jgi:predicted CoA-binding protein
MDQNAEACPLPSKDDDAHIREILERPRTIAVVGMSPKPDRPSNEVGLYLHHNGFRIIPVHPKAEEIAGLKVYPDLESIPKDMQIDIVDLFVGGERTMEPVEAAARIGAKIVWFQPGAENGPAEDRAKALGLEVISGRCTKAEHQRLLG